MWYEFASLNKILDFNTSLANTNVQEKLRTIIAKIIEKFNFLKFINDKIIAINESIIEFILADFSTHKYENNTVEVTTDQRKEPIVEKNNNFHIFSQVLSHFNSSDNKGIVWLAKKTGIKNRKNDDIKINQK